jgi:hypothetical protein
VIRHVVCLTWTAEATAAQRAAVIDALRELPARIPEIRSYEVGADLGLQEGNADLVVVAGFDDESGYRAYAAHPAHQRILREMIRPIMAGRTAVQSAVGEA